LTAVAALIPAEGAVADIGADHGRLSVWLAAGGRKAIAVDVSGPSLRKASALVREYGVDGAVECRLGDGLSCLRDGEVSVAVMAGMGALTMIGILSEGLRMSRVPRDLVLQPMNAVETLRRWLHENGWGITAEGYGREAGGIWPVFRASAGAQDPAERFDYLIGNWEMASGHPLFREYLKQEIERCGRRLTGAAGGKGSAAARRAAELADRMNCYKGAFIWYARRELSSN
jgi:tRNA (adenine22-N1)-methyltransferase